MVADLTPGERGSEIPAMASAGGLAYFVRLANQLPNPFASTLYRSDGTAAGTFAMPSPGAAVSVPVEAIGKAFYVAGPAGSVGLYETDGTVAGTRVLRPGAATMAGTPTALFYETDGTLYRYDGNATTVLRTGTPIRLMTVAPGYLLIQQDGLNYFQIVDTTTGELSSIPAATSTGFRYTVLGDRIVFEAAGQPWLTDGTVAGTQPIVPSGGGSFAHPGESIEVGGTVYFTAELAGAQSPGGELFKLTAGAPGATLVADIMPGPFGSFPRGFTAYQGRLYFMASDPEHGEELWSTDGTEDGTRLELDAHPGPASSGSQFQVLGDRLLFIGDAALSGRELYQLDPGAGPNGTSGYHLVYDTNAQGAGAAFGSTPFPAAAVMGGRMFFAADDFNARGMEPWVSDGTPAGTRPFKDLFPGSGSSYPHLFTPYAGWVYFVAGGTGLVGEEWLWSTDGTDAGTSRVGAMHHVRTLTVAGGKLYAGTYDDGLWVVDSPDAPAREVRAAATGGRLTRVQAPAAVGDSLYFGAGEGGTSAPTQIWRTDGSAATPLTTFSDVSFINDGAAARGKYFFLRN
jgi:ELWxxDGT repeat protein